VYFEEIGVYFQKSVHTARESEKLYGVYSNNKAVNSTVHSPYTFLSCNLTLLFVLFHSLPGPKWNISDKENRMKSSHRNCYSYVRKMLMFFDLRLQKSLHCSENSQRRKKFLLLANSCEVWKYSNSVRGTDWIPRPYLLTTLFNTGALCTLGKAEEMRNRTHVWMRIRIEVEVYLPADFKRHCTVQNTCFWNRTEARVLNCI